MSTMFPVPPMSPMSEGPRSLPTWQRLQAHAQTIRHAHLRDWFDGQQGEARGAGFVAEAAGLTLDYAKNRVTDTTMALLFALADEAGVSARRDAMYRGEAVNTTERRAALHMALRAWPQDGFHAQGVAVAGDVAAVLSQMERFADAVRGGTWRGWNGRRITDVINIGIGGSDLGPRSGLPRARAPGHRRAAPAFCRQRGWQRSGRRARAAGRRQHAGGGLLQDLHHAGDHGQRAHRAHLVPAPRRAAGTVGQPLRRGLHQPASGGRVRHRPRQYVPVLGLGGRALFAMVRGGAVDCAGGWLCALSPVARRRARHGPAFCRGRRAAKHADDPRPARRVVSQLPGHRQPLRGAVLRAA